jgi:cell division protein FtsX
MIHRLRSAIRRAVLIAARRPRLAAWAIAAVAAAAVAFGAAQLVARNLDRWASGWRGGATMVVYLAPMVSADRARAIATELDALDGVVAAELVTADDANRRLREALGSAGELLDGVDPAALPASIELVLEPGARDVVAASPLIGALRGSDAVDDVELVGEWVDRVGSLLGALRAAAWSIVIVFGLLAIVVVTATTRLRVATRRDEARVARLLGAGPAYTTWPTILAGAIQGAVGAALALPILWLMYRELGPAAAASLSRTVGPGDTTFLSVPGMALIVGAGLAIGALGGVLACDSPEVGTDEARGRRSSSFAGGIADQSEPPRAGSWRSHAKGERSNSDA